MKVITEISKTSVFFKKVQAIFREKLAMWGFHAKECVTNLLRVLLSFIENY